MQFSGGEFPAESPGTYVSHLNYHSNDMIARPYADMMN